MEEIKQNAKEYFEEYMSGEPLTQDAVIDALVDFYIDQHKLFLVYIQSYINIPEGNFDGE